LIVLFRRQVFFMQTMPFILNLDVKFTTNGESANLDCIAEEAFL